jgi:uncharacterized membrane protein YgcG
MLLVLCVCVCVFFFFLKRSPRVEIIFSYTQLCRIIPPCHSSPLCIFAPFFFFQAPVPTVPTTSRPRGYGGGGGFGGSGGGQRASGSFGDEDDLDGDSD